MNQQNPTASGNPAGSASTGRSGVLRPAYTLWQRELVRFFRQRNRVIGAIATPLVFWLLLGAGLDRPMAFPMDAGADGAVQEMGYLAYFFPGALVLMLLFTAIFSTISVIEDRREGFLQGVLVSPASRLAIALGKVAGGATIATLQGLLFLALWPLLGGFPGLLPMLGCILAMLVLAAAMTSLGLCLAWVMDSTAGYHAVMNLFLMPMWFLSGAVFPFATAPGWQKAVMIINPLTYGHTLIVSLLTGQPYGLGGPVSAGVAAGVLLLSTAALLALATWIVSRRRKDGS